MKAKPPTKTAREYARRVAVTELIKLAEVAATSKVESVRAFGVIALKRAVRLATGARVSAYNQDDVRQFLKWWRAR